MAKPPTPTFVELLARADDEEDEIICAYEHMESADLADVVIGDTTASPPPLVHFSLNFLGRDWFGAGLKGSETMTFTQLMLSIYYAYIDGLLMTKKDAMRTIGAEHVATTKRYSDIAVELGLITIKESMLDKRIELLVLTKAGIVKVEQELEAIRRSAEWLNAALSGDTTRELELRPALTVELPPTGQLTLVADPIAARQPDKKDRDLPPRSVARYLAAYAETARLMPSDTYALDHASSILMWRAKREDLENALAAVDKMEIRQPNKHLVRRGRIHLMLSNFDNAIADITKHYELNPSDIALYRDTRARAYMGKKMYGEALDDLDTVLKSYGNPFGDTIKLRGLALAGLGRFEEALTPLEQELAREVALQGEHQQMLKVMKDVVARHPSLSDVLASASYYGQYDLNAKSLSELIEIIKKQVHAKKSALSS